MVQGEDWDVFADASGGDVWCDVSSSPHTFENRYPGTDVWFDRDCGQMVGPVSGPLNINWDGKPQVWTCQGCTATYSTRVAADSCCLTGLDALHFAIEYHYLAGNRVKVDLTLTALDEQGDPWKPETPKEKPQLDPTPLLEEDTPLEERFDYNTIAKRH